MGNREITWESLEDLVSKSWENGIIETYGDISYV